MVFPKSFERLYRFAFAPLLISVSLMSTTAGAATPEALAAALRMNGTICGGLMPPDDPAFQQMVTLIEGGNYNGAALVAAQSPYFARYLGRRLALQMQNPTLDASAISDSDATTHILYHFVGPSPSISSIWSDNST